MPVHWVPARDQLVQAAARTIVQEGGRSPELDQGGRIEEELSLIEPARGPDIVRLEVGHAGYRSGRSRSPLRAPKHGFSAAGRPAEPACFELRAGQRLERPEVSSSAAATSSLCTVNRMWLRPERTAVSAVSRTPVLMAGGVRMGPEKAFGVLRVAHTVVEQIPVQAINSPSSWSGNWHSFASLETRLSRR